MYNLNNIFRPNSNMKNYITHMKSLHLLMVSIGSNLINTKCIGKLVTPCFSYRKLHCEVSKQQGGLVVFVLLT
jgi:hypothetical protein